MKALTVCNPYPELMARNEKLIENRGWRTNYRGPLAIHAGLSRKYLETWPEEIDDLVFGAVVAVCRLDDCIHLDDPAGFDRVLDNGQMFLGNAHAHGPWCWILKDMHRLSAPFVTAGAQNFWTLDARVVRYDPNGGDISKSPDEWDVDDKFSMVASTSIEHCSRLNSSPKGKTTCL